MEGVEFKSWEKMTRENPFRVTISEKIDGTNACIIIQDGVIVGCQSRKRLITPEDDNYGFAGWVYRNTEELSTLGDGHHFGEWAGLGIQKNPHKLESKRFFLFNTFRWNENNPNLPDICSVVPVLFDGVMTESTVPLYLSHLTYNGSVVGGEPEGVVVYYHALRKYTKHTIKSPDGKWCKE